MKVRLKELRKAQGWTQEAAAERLRITKSHVSEMESGKKNPSGPLLDRMSEVFGVPVPDLIVAEPGMPDDLGYLIASFQAMGEKDQAAILQMARRLTSRDS